MQRSKGHPCSRRTVSIPLFSQNCRLYLGKVYSFIMSRFYIHKGYPCFTQHQGAPCGILIFMLDIHSSKNNIIDGNQSHPIILDGRKLRDLGVDRLKAVIEKSGKKPTLAIIQVGDLSESNAYINQKKKFAEKIGAVVTHKQFPDDVSEQTLISEIEKLNGDSSVSGIIFQLPVPARLDKQKIIDAIVLEKDTDGLTSENKKLFEAGDPRAVAPATARGVLSLLRGYDIPVYGKKVTIIGRSALVGAPIAVLLKREGAEVTVCHRGTSDISGKCRTADILIVSAGNPLMVTKEYVSPGQIVVDVGINSIEKTESDPVSVEKLEYEIPKRRIVGDVDFDAVKNIVGAISPVPGGVGPMTVLSLFENLVSAGETKQN